MLELASQMTRSTIVSFSDILAQLTEDLQRSLNVNVNEEPMEQDGDEDVEDENVNLQFSAKSLLRMLDFHSLRKKQLARAPTAPPSRWNTSTHRSPTSCETSLGRRIADSPSPSSPRGS